VCCSVLQCVTVCSSALQCVPHQLVSGIYVNCVNLRGAREVCVCREEGGVLHMYGILQRTCCCVSVDG